MKKFKMVVDMKNILRVSCSRKIIYYKTRSIFENLREDEHVTRDEGNTLKSHGHNVRVPQINNWTVCD